MESQATARDQTAIELQLAGVAARLHARPRVDLAQREQLDGQRTVLQWVLHQVVESPVSLAAIAPTRQNILDELALAGSASLDSGPAQDYALGAYEALRWLTGVRSEDLVTA